MEKYLKDEYNVIEDEKWLTKEENIEGFFSEDFSDFFKCGQGFYEDEVSLIAKIKDKFYEVNISAEIESSKQDRGDRLYWVESIKSVSYVQIEKPLPKAKISVNYSLSLTKHQKQEIERKMKELKIGF